ncbi:uncharacterized protein A4U43_C07F16440 [Asparagus officinalis]|uniref:Uncharacterized protein n=1 Tax=Asparagus officinalis TaxID=4686 RepID=A0A5P1ECI2_ASPOF|nr:uncharacterized protein A4U43_C07F16440 [Asparagus officinalis]
MTVIREENTLHDYLHNPQKTGLAFHKLLLDGRLQMIIGQTPPKSHLVKTRSHLLLHHCHLRQRSRRHRNPSLLPHPHTLSIVKIEARPDQRRLHRRLLPHRDDPPPLPLHVRLPADHCRQLHHRVNDEVDDATGDASVDRRTLCRGAPGDLSNSASTSSCALASRSLPAASPPSK